MQAEALFAPSPVRGQLEPQDEANRPGYLYLQCTDTPNELKVLLPPRPAFLYSQLLIAELATLSNREAIDWNKLLRIRHLKDRMIRKCLRLERQMAPRRKLDGISFIALPAPETFRLKELERWYQDWELEQDALGQGDYMPTTPPKKQASPELRRGSTCCERCAHAPPPASPTPSQRASRRTSMGSMQRGSMIISPGPPVAYVDHHHHAHHHHHHPPQMDDTSPSPSDDGVHHQEEFYHDHGHQEYTPQPMPPPPPPEPQHEMSPTPLPESQMQLQSELSPTPMPEPPMHLHGTFSPDPIPIPYRQSAAIENPMSLSYLASQLRDSPSPQPLLGATPMSPIPEDPASLIDETPQPMPVPMPLPVPMPVPVPVPEPVPHRTGIPRRRSSLKRSNSTISLPKTVAWADLSDQMARVGLAAGAADDEGGKNFEAVKSVIVSQITGLGSLRQNIASSLDQLRMKTEILQKEAERLLQDEESMREKERQLQMTLESLELRHTERQ